MIHAHGTISVEADRDLDTVLRAFDRAKHIIRDADGCHSVTLFECIEDPERLILLVEWESVEHHRRFSASPALAEWRDLMGPFFTALPSTLYLRTIGSA